MSKHLDETKDILDIGKVYCPCGCGEEATQIYNGIPIPSINPMLHYRRWKQKMCEIKHERKYRLQL